MSRGDSSLVVGEFDPWSEQQSYSEWLASTGYKATQPELTAEEKSRPYAKYYDEEIRSPDSSHLEKMEAPTNPEHCIYPEQLNDLLDPGYLDVEIGWCNLANGAGFIANRLHYPDVTAEMVNWWFCWHALESLRYRIWYPPQHAATMLSPESRKRLLDPSIPMEQRNWGTTHHVTEDINCGMENIDITFLSPADFGFDMTRWHVPNVSAFAGGYGWSAAVDKINNPMTAPALMCHVFRPHPDGGIEQRTRFWMGYRFAAGGPELCLPPGMSVPESVVKGLALHTVNEFSHFRALLPRLFTEFGADELG